MKIASFEFARVPKILFGVGRLLELESILPVLGNEIALVTGKRSLERSGKFEVIKSLLEKLGIIYHLLKISGEPSPAMVDEAVLSLRDKKIQAVVGIGGGSAIDAAKAISALLPQDEKVSVKDFLEGVGTKKHDGRKVPFVAIPTTSGTGSEATKNAVISEIGPDGFKKSLRHDNLVPDFAIIDPELMISCPSSVSASCGMDAFTQLIEAFVSNKASAMTDALAWSGLKAMNENLLLACTTGSANLSVRGAVAYGALMSGIVLANAGLGIIHGLASPIGGFFEVPHGVACGTLLAEATKINIQKLKEHPGSPEVTIALQKHAQVGSLLAGDRGEINGKVNHYLDVLVSKLEEWVDVLGIPRLGEHGIVEMDIDKIVSKTGLKNNPVHLNPEDIKLILMNRI
ncbi:MAG: iron-containing alcohol dehydrogenase [Candidatus Helarchaeota archaeon]